METHAKQQAAIRTAVNRQDQELTKKVEDYVSVEEVVELYDEMVVISKKMEQLNLGYEHSPY